MLFRRNVLPVIAIVVCCVTATVDGDVNPNYLYDTNGDGFITDDDTLAVIAHLNSEGSGCISNPTYNYNLFVDVDLDGCNAPNDALILINFLYSHPWQNPDEAFDVDDDGFVAPNDALIVINEINANGTGPFTLGEACHAPYLDADGDNELTENDAQVIIDYLSQ